MEMVKGSLNQLHFKVTLDSKVKVDKRESLGYIKITRSSYSPLLKYLIQESIDTFNQEVDWDDMWDIKDCEIRLFGGQTLFLLLDNSTVIGHLWYKQNTLYNVFVSNQRKDGDSTWFVQETLWDMKETKKLTYVELWVDTWNERAIQFWKKLNFKQLPN